MTDLLERSYLRFNAIVAAVLLIGVLIVVLLATVSYSQLQALFDLLLGAIIALELAHSVHLMVTGRRGLAQVRIVLVIGILAVVRKLIVVELEQVSGILLLGLAAAIVALGAVFGLLSWLDHKKDIANDDLGKHL